MPDLSLTCADIQEILSSLLISELPYNARIQLTKNAHLPPEFVPSTNTIPKLDSAAKTICHMLHAPLSEDIGTISLATWAKQLFRHWRSNGQRITFFTSGSTGRPKPSTHELALHWQEANALAQIFHGRKRIISYVPRHHIYGFIFSILLPKALNVPVKWEVPLPLPGLTKNLISGDLVVAIPLLWSKMNNLDVMFGTGIQGVTSTGPCSPDIISGLCKKGLEHMYEFYGSSETGGVGYRTTPAAPYKLLPHWNRTDDDTILMRGTNKKQTYKLQDVLQWDGNRFFPKRRADNCVQVAGINVYPERIKGILATHPGVKDCAVRLMSPPEGERLKAFIVPKSGVESKQLESNLRTWAKKNLTPSETPRSWTFGENLPVNSMGKASDW